MDSNLNTHNRASFDELIGEDEIRPDLLLQYLRQFQQHHSYVPQAAMAYLSEQTGVSLAEIRGLVGFYSFLHATPRGNYDVLFSDSYTDHMAGSLELLARFCRTLGVEPGQPRQDGRLSVDTTSCTGMCDQAPAILINGLAITRLTEERIDIICNLIEQNVELEKWPKAFFSVTDNIRRTDILLAKRAMPGNSLRLLMQEGAEAVLKKLEDSGLRGRGGAGFSTAAKWRMCKQAPGDERYVICNADEGEPGTFKDRVLLNSYADDVIEGMTLCAGVIGAQKGFIYLRGEYLYLLESLQQALEIRREAGLLGDNILGHSEFNFDIEIHLGAGSYVCGEESALIESLEGKRGTPRNRPPFPVTEGYMNKPTVVDNVETLVATVGIAVHGVDWFNSRGSAESSGTKLLSISGDCHYPGIYEYPFGVPLSQVMVDCGAINPRAVHVAGAAGHTWPESEFDHKLCFEDVSTGGSFIVLNDQRNLLDMVKNFTDFFAHESCGHCTPCRVGCSLLQNLLDKVINHKASSYDLDEIRSIAEVMVSASRCGLGQTAPNPIISTMDNIPELYLSRLKSTEYTPSFSLNDSLNEAREITGRTDAGAYLEDEA